MKLCLSIALLALVSVAVAYRIHSSTAPTTRYPLMAYVPQDASLAIETPDFAGLLQRWSSSTQCKAWIASANYSVFQNSRLFGRLGDAQTSFETAAGVPLGTDLLHQVAGKDSVFAWYDVGKLEFLYISRMPASQASQVQLLQSRGSFERRHVGNDDFYIKTSGSAYSTVAFARVSTPSGDLLLLATREDLIANALKLIAGHADTSAVSDEPWFHDASAALAPGKAAPALHMVLNLDRIALLPQFQTYWIQRNVSWMRTFRAGTSDLYLEQDRFREERALIPKSSPPEMLGTSVLPALAELSPASAGVFRVVATRDPSAVVIALQEKLFSANTAAAPASTGAPDPDLATPEAGSADDLEVRIDTLPPQPASASWEALKQTTQQSGLDALMTLSSAQNSAEPSSLWVPIHSAVVLHAARGWDAQALALALQGALRGSLTASNIGISFKTETIGGVTVYALDGPRPLFFAVSSATPRGNLVLLADNRPMFEDLLASLTKSSTQTSAEIQNDITLIAAFNHTSQAAPYRRLTSLIDGAPQKAPSGASDAAADTNNADSTQASAPAFFSSTIDSLSTSFAGLQSERITERSTEGFIRQTVIYAW